jgi:sialic acid synthase SpsE
LFKELSTPLIIAEAGVNHNGELNLALELVDIASEAGADFVKFQTFNVDSLTSTNTPLASYQEKSASTVSNQNELLASLELSFEDFRTILKHCEKKGIGFLSTAFDVKGLRFLIDELGIPMIKIASGDLTFGPLIFEASLSQLPMIVSTGMANLDEIQDALELIEFGLSIAKGEISKSEAPSKANRKALWESKKTHNVQDKVVLLHCTSQYPAPVESLNLRAIKTISENFSIPVGYSDHSINIGVSCAAIALGATVIEKHFTTDKSLPGPDHSASLDPAELHYFVNELRDTFASLGKPYKVCQEIEVDTRSVARRAIRVNKFLPEGETIALENLTFFRPDGRTSPMATWDVVGTVTGRLVEEGEEI